MQQDNTQDDIAARLLKRVEQLESERTTWESHWREIDRYVSPSPSKFYGNDIHQGGQKLNEFIFDSTATLALHDFAASIESVITPRTMQWHSLSTSNYNLDQNRNVKIYLQQLVDILFKVRYSAQANFASQTNEVYESLGKFGTGCLLIEDDLAGGLYYKAIHISEIIVAQNNRGVIDTVFRKFEFTSAQARDAWGEEALPDMIAERLEDNPDKKFNFVHCVQPNHDYLPGSIHNQRMKYSSFYICKETKSIVSKGGYRTFPYAVVRYQTSINEVYGRSPAMEVLPDIKMLQNMSRIDLNAAQLAVMPPLLAPAKGILSAFNMVPGAINYGGTASDGRPMIAPLMTGGQVNIGEAMCEQRRQVVQTAFLKPLFQMLSENPAMTATEVIMRNNEKAALLAPPAGRIQNELLGPMIERELDILAHAGVLPPIPDELLQIGGYYEITYQGPFNQAQRSQEAIALLQLVQNLAPLAQFDPTVVQTVDFDVLLRRLADIANIDADVLRTPEMIEQIKQQNMQTQQLQQMLQAAPIAADTAKTLAQTHQLASQPAPGMVQ